MQIDLSSLANRGLGRLVRMPLHLIPESSVVPMLQGPMRGRKWIAGSSNHGCWLGSYEMQKRRIIEQRIRENGVLFDVGANVGFYTLLSSLLVGEGGRVVSFEPDPRNVRFLKRHIDLNSLSNVTVMDVAVSREKGVANFAFAHNNCMGHLGDGNGVQVRTVCLDDYVSENGIVPDYIKLDVEGAEHMVLEGSRNLLRSNRPTLFLATHGPEQESACLGLLRQYGYNIRCIEPNEFVCD